MCCKKPCNSKVVAYDHMPEVWPFPMWVEEADTLDLPLKFFSKIIFIIFFQLMSANLFELAVFSLS